MTQFTEIFQPEIWFFDPTKQPPSQEVRAWWASTENPDNPFHNFVGNQHAVRRLCRVAFEVFGRHDRECSDYSFALLGPSSSGKATLARLFGDLICLPFVEVDAHSVNDINDVVVAIAKVLEATPIKNCQYETLEMQDLGDGQLIVPPCVVFIDGFENLSRKVEQGLRQAFAGSVQTNGWKLDTRTICWIISSNELLLPNGLDRFTTIRMKPLSIEEVAQVVALHNPDLPVEVCRLVAQHASMPREALAFAKEMRTEFEMNGGDWQHVAVAVAKDWGLTTTTPWTNRVRRNGCN